MDLIFDSKRWFRFVLVFTQEEMTAVSILRSYCYTDETFNYNYNDHYKYVEVFIYCLLYMPYLTYLLLPSLALTCCYFVEN